jgi:hypothetical protein
MVSNMPDDPTEDQLRQFWKETQKHKDVFCPVEQKIEEVVHKDATFACQAPSSLFKEHKDLRDALERRGCYVKMHLALRKEKAHLENRIKARNLGWCWSGSLYKNPAEHAYLLGVLEEVFANEDPIGNNDFTIRQDKKNIPVFRNVRASIVG